MQQMRALMQCWGNICLFNQTRRCGKQMVCAVTECEQAKGMLFGMRLMKSHRGVS